MSCIEIKKYRFTCDRCNTIIEMELSLGLSIPQGWKTIGYKIVNEIIPGDVLNYPLSAITQRPVHHCGHCIGVSDKESDKT